MPVTILTHPDCLKHEMGAGHPESPARLEAIAGTLKQAPWAKELDWQEAPRATKEQLQRVHPIHYIESIFAVSPKEGYVHLDPDTAMNPYTLSAALHAAGAQIAAVDLAFSKTNDRTSKQFCLVRPPGHHAEPDTAMGFCFFNNVAVGAAHALAKYGCKRIAIIDFDVHHGNGTETMFTNEPRVCFWSSFQHPFYPGASLEGKPKHIHLRPLRADTTGEEFRQRVDSELVPILDSFQPECLFISAGFDAHRLDPLANLSLEASDYAYITKAVCNIATKYAAGRVISTLEGGYHLRALPESVAAHVGAMLEK
ncbi:MAG: histone deacetylase family protein [Candidatus Berkiella sp.]